MRKRAFILPILYLRRIGQICAGQRAITSDTALRLAAFFGTDAQSWVNLQAHYDIELSREIMADTLKRIHRYEPEHV